MRKKTQLFDKREREMLKKEIQKGESDLALACEEI